MQAVVIFAEPGPASGRAAQRRRAMAGFMNYMFGHPGGTFEQEYRVYSMMMMPGRQRDDADKGGKSKQNPLKEDKKRKKRKRRRRREEERKTRGKRNGKWLGAAF